MATAAVQANYGNSNANMQSRHNIIRQISDNDTVQIARNVVKKNHPELLAHINAATDTAMQQVQNSTSKAERKVILNNSIHQANALMTEIIGSSFDIMSSADLNRIANILGACPRDE